MVWRILNGGLSRLFCWLTTAWQNASTIPVVGEGY
jgi:hypothetical protein